MQPASQHTPAPNELFQPAHHWLDLLRSRQIGAVELLNLHLDQLGRHHAAINAVVAKDVEGALAAARNADNTPDSQRGPLHGLPMTIKDTFEVAGMPATCGLPPLAQYRPQQDAEAVSRLKAAGAIVYGKTNVPPGAFDWQSSNPIYGTTRNPWNVDRSPGGSSGGPAAALAAAFTSLELGSDIGGSIRVPASFCGVYGHKPTYGIVPTKGHIPPMPGVHANLQVPLGVTGPMARSARDLELALDLLVAPPASERTAWQVSVPPSRHEQLQDFRVAVWADDRSYATDHGGLTAIHAWAHELRRLGVQVDTEARPDIDWHASYDTYLDTLLHLMGLGTPAEEVQQMIEAGRGQDPQSYPARLARVLSMPHHQYFDVLARRDALYRQWQAFFTRFDVLVCPAYCTVAYPHDHRGAELPPVAAGEARRMIVNGIPRPYFDGLQWPSIATVANLPATAMPIGHQVDGMPMGVQVIGPYLEDRTPLRFVQLLEDTLGGCQLPPLADRPATSV